MLSASTVANHGMSVAMQHSDTEECWYAISVLSRHERLVAQQIKEAVNRASMQNDVKKIIVPAENVIEIRRGKKISRERIFMPGYILIQMKMTDRGYHLIKDIGRVAGFLGADGTPDPMPESEVEEILNRAETGQTTTRALITFEVGDRVAITDGPLEGWNGTVEDVDNDSRRVVIGVMIFGRVTQTDLSFDQVTKEA